MNLDQIMSQTINDIDDFVVRLSNNINEENLAKLENYKSQIKQNLDSQNPDWENICKEAIKFMQNFELEQLEANKKQDESKLLQDLLSQTVNISANSTIIDDKITVNKSSRFKNIYYKYFYKWEVAEKDFDEDRLIYDIVDNIYILTLYVIIIMILAIFAKNYFDQSVLWFYEMFFLAWFWFAVWLCDITKTNNNISLLIDIFIFWCFGTGFWLIKLYFAIW